MDPEGEFAQIIGGIIGGAIAGAVWGAATDAIIAYGVSGGDLKAVGKAALSGGLSGALTGGITGGLIISGLGPYVISSMTAAGISPLAAGLEQALWRFPWPKIAAIIMNAITWDLRHPADLMSNNLNEPCSNLRSDN